MSDQLDPVSGAATDAGAPTALESGGRAMAATVALAALAVEAGLLLASTWGQGLAVLLGGQALVLAAMGAWAFRPARRTARYPVLLWIATASFGPFGPAGVLLAMMLEWHYARRATSVEEWHAMLFPPTHVDENAELWRRIGQRASDLAGEQPVTPFLDVLAFGSIPQRQSAIAIIAQHFHPAFAPALRAALRDQHNVIRVQAATAIARLENEFLERTLALEAAAREVPEGAAAVLTLAAHYDDQAFAGLLDPTREEECRVKAADGYERYLRRHPADDPARFRFARLQQRRGLSSEAERLFRQLVDAGYPGARQWLMESLFSQGRYAELREVAAAQSARLEDSVVPEVAATMALWAGGEAVA
ncbi:MAG: hypothetical protein OEW19_09765 [Acidobacteriota bacterium]|nr:hypothetical protein [Acidobacteriota bacterium]